jgi:hypothetical protein
MTSIGTEITASSGYHQTEILPNVAEQIGKFGSMKF